MAAAKESPMNFRLRKIQRPNKPGKSTLTEDAAKATNNKGTAQRTESWIIEETARALLNSTPIIENTITVDIGSVISQNRFQLLMNLLCSKSAGFVLIEMRLVYGSRKLPREFLGANIFFC